MRKNMGDFTAAVITVSDKAYAGIRKDEGGPALISYLESKGLKVVYSEVVPDEAELIQKSIIEASRKGADLILTTGGTGFSVRDITPEATLSLIERQVPGITEYIRMKSAENNPYAVLSRAVCGIFERSIVLNLPGKPKGAVESLALVLDPLLHGIEILKGEVTEHA
ncbi:MAG: MogA/MoaB family molybdenum cofactor biosynthesis protein [Actinobacteria bacterium]|nr:MogA/MoaB family molybdenum cofactor biosynthesis protein [Actinomycetota bacterium]